MTRTRSLSTTLLPFAAALALAGCAETEEDTTYEADATDVSGGDLIVTEEDPSAVPVDTPDTPMTNVPTDPATPTPAATSEPTAEPAEPIAD